MTTAALGIPVKKLYMNYNNMAHIKYTYSACAGVVFDKYAVARRNAVTRARAYEEHESNVHRLFLDQISPSNGELLLRRLRREQRDAIQQACARRRANILRKSKPKRERSEDVARERDEKYAHMSDYFTEDIVEQSGVVTGVAALVGALSAGAMALSARRCVSTMEKNMEVLSHKL